VPATSSTAAHDVLKVKCTLCGVFKTWSSWIRVRAHLSADDAMALGAGTSRCMNAPPEVSARFKSIITVAHAEARQRAEVRRGAAAVNAAIESAARPASAKQQRSIESAFSTQTRAQTDAAVANCFYACNLPFSLSSSVTFKRMCEAIKVAPPSWRPPERHRFTGDLLTTTEARLEGVKGG
jgi:hypothetical protein